MQTKFLQNDLRGAYQIRNDNEIDIESTTRKEVDMTAKIIHRAKTIHIFLQHL